MMPFTPEQVEKLSGKLSPDHIKPPKQYGPKGDYIEGWHAIAEANRIFGFDGWSYDIVACECVFQGARAIGKDKKDGFGVTYVARISVMSGGVQRVDVGSGHGYDVDCGIAHESAIKEAVTDALKRALRTFGNPFGLALYDKSRENVGYDDRPSEVLTALISNIPQTSREHAIAWRDKQKPQIDELNEKDFNAFKSAWTENLKRFTKPASDDFPGDRPSGSGVSDAEARNHVMNAG